MDEDARPAPDAPHDPVADLTALVAVDVRALSDEGVRRHVKDLHRAKAMVDAAVIEATDVLDGRTIWAGDLARSAAGWLVPRVDTTARQARADVEVARTLRHCPVMAAAFAAGRLGRTKVDALVATRQPEVAEIFAAQETYLVDQVEALRVVDARQFLAAWLQQARLAVGWTDAEVEPGDGEGPRASLSLSQTFGGRWVLDGEWDVELGTKLRSSLDAELDDMFRVGMFNKQDGLTTDQRQALALLQIVFRKTRVGIKNGEIRPSIEIVVDAKTLAGLPITDAADQASRICETRAGTPIAPQTAKRLLCEAVMRRVLIGAGGEVLDLGKTERFATRAQKRALAFAHRGCEFPGCSAPAAWCDAHHIDHWNPDPNCERGATDMANLCLLCELHHHRTHAHGYHLTRAPDGMLDVQRPDGTPVDRCHPRRAPAHTRPHAA